MKNISRLFLVPLVILAFAGSSFAQAKPASPASLPKKAEVKAEKPKTTRISGVVTSADVKTGVLTVKAKDKDMSFTAETKAAMAALGKVKARDRVNISYSEKNGKLIAHSMTAAKVTTAAKAPAPAKATETKPAAKGAEKK